MNLISKSAFIKAEQCLKYFYLYKNHLYLRDKLSKDKQFIFKRGIDVGVYAQQFFPNGIDVTADEKQNQVLFAQKTQTLIAQGITTIYEATFIYNNLSVMVDILHLSDNGWVAYEVKSSLKISETYVKDACFQYYVIKNCLPDLVGFNLLTLNPKYVLDTDIDIKQLFKVTSVIKDAQKNEDYFDHKTKIAQHVLEQNKIPDIAIGTHCFQPYDCDFIGTCWKDMQQEGSIFSLGKLSKQTMLDFYNNNIKQIKDIDINSIEKQDLKTQILATQQQTEQVNKEELSQFINTISGKVCSMDIEVWMPAIPFYNGTKPFEMIPFLFSMVSEQTNHIEKHSYLKPITEDNREQFLIQLIDATTAFDFILVYDKSLEESVLNQLQQLFPNYKNEINHIKLKIVDLAIPIKKGSYYHPEMKGNFTLKSLASIVSDTTSFNDLDVQSGISAMYMYEGLLTSDTIFDHENVKQALINYCEMDALTTYQLYLHLLQKTN